ncbi:MAG TPA: futalosine hydrolase [Phycisphaerales bacterium]|nr:futalosine hydrolase [Phycisphaerales bacterium]HMP36767.1 futalosine hydrolase [Phycisphaerales bacterium]
MSLLIVVAVEREAEAVHRALEEAGIASRRCAAVVAGARGGCIEAARGERSKARPPSVRIAVAGVGRVNAAVATACAVLEAPTGLVLSAGIAGSLPGSGLILGEVVVAAECVYVEEGIVTPAGFLDMARLGFPLGDFAGNRVPVDPEARSLLGGDRHSGPIATVATCSGTDDAAAAIVARTGALAEAMEGAAVVHAARRFGVGAVELRAISNETGDRARQRWNLDEAFARLQAAVARDARGLLALASSRVPEG